MRIYKKKYDYIFRKGDYLEIHAMLLLGFIERNQGPVLFPR